MSKSDSIEEEIYSRNRIRLSETIYQLGRFTLDQLYDAYAAKFNEGENMSLGGGWSIRDYLDYLRELGAIKKDHNYTVINN